VIPKPTVRVRMKESALPKTPSLRTAQ
jgi:hypothetical protein